jgi:hypothetical protein
MSAYVVAVLVLAACGSSGSDATTTTGHVTQSATSSAPAPAKEPEPTGHLSPGEYKSVHAATMHLQGLEKTKNLQQAVRITRESCALLTTQTALVEHMKSICAQSVRLLAAVRGIKLHKGECNRALKAGDVSCWSNVFRLIGRAARVGGVRESALRAVVGKRKLAPVCAKEIAGGEKDLANTRAITHDALSAAHAAEARDQLAFIRATHRLDADFKRDGSHETARQTLRRVATCR